MMWKNENKIKSGSRDFQIQKTDPEIQLDVLLILFKQLHSFNKNTSTPWYFNIIIFSCFCIQNHLDSVWFYIWIFYIQIVWCLTNST